MIDCNSPDSKIFRKINGAIPPFDQLPISLAPKGPKSVLNSLFEGVPDKSPGFIRR